MKKKMMIQESKSMILGVLFLLVMGFLLGACGGGGNGATTTVQTLPAGTGPGGILGPIVSQTADLRMSLCAQAGDTAVKCRFPGMQFAEANQKVDSLFAKYQAIQ